MLTATTPSQAAIKVFRDAMLKIRPTPNATRLWIRHLTPQDRERLGGDLMQAYWNFEGTAGMWIEVRGVTYTRAVVEVACLLGYLRNEDKQWLLRETGDDVDAEEAMRNAIAQGDLVLVERPREAYWDSEQINIDWYAHNVLWEFLWELARHSKSGRPIDAFTFGANVDHNVVTKRKSRLTNMDDFPVDLGNLIEPAGRGSQQLTLGRERIRVFEESGVDSISEWLP